jgi:hypothetical protein
MIKELKIDVNKEKRLENAMKRNQDFIFKISWGRNGR